MSIFRLKVIVWVCCSLLLAACRLGSVPATNLAAQKQTVPENWFKLIGVARIGDLGEALSPNGLWLSDFIQAGTDNSFRVFSTTDSTLVLESKIDKKTGFYLSLHAWAPDSSAITVYGADQGRAGCPFNRMIIYTITNNGGQLTPAIFQPAIMQDAYCVLSVWSPDSSELAVSFNNQEILIINKQAQLLQTIPVKLKATETLTDLRWTNFGLFYLVMNTQNMDQIYYDVNRIDLQNPGVSKSLLHRHYWTFSMVGADPTSQRLLLEEVELEDQQGKSFKLLIMNSDTQAIENTLEANGVYCKSADSSILPFTALQVARVGEPCGGDTDLWMYNWDTGKLLIQGKIDTLVGWQSAAQGFQVARETAPGQFEFEIIKPTSETK